MCFHLATSHFVGPLGLVPYCSLTKPVAAFNSRHMLRFIFIKNKASNRLLLLHVYPFPFLFPFPFPFPLPFPFPVPILLLASVIAVFVIIAYGITFGSNVRYRAKVKVNSNWILFCPWKHLCTMY